MNIKEIISKLETLQCSIDNTIIKELIDNIYKLHLDNTNYISKNINEIDILQDNVYELHKRLQQLTKEYNKLKVELCIRDNIIYIKNKRIIRLYKQYNINKKKD